LQESHALFNLKDEYAQRQYRPKQCVPMPDTCRPLYNAVQERDILTDMANCRARRFPINGD